MEAILSSVVDEMLSSMLGYIFDRLISSSESEILKFVRQDQVSSQLNKWRTLLPKINAVLDDAEDKQMVSRVVKLWLSDLRDIVYDAEDVIDEIATEDRRQRILEETGMTGTGSKVRRIFPNCCFTGLNLSGVKFTARMGSKIEEITRRFDNIVARMNALNFLERSSGKGRLERAREGQRQTSSLVDEYGVYGREMDKEEIIQQLMKVEIGEIGVVSVVGMGGVGKTTLARFVYNDQEVKTLFELRVWVCVSEDFDVVRVTEILLQAVTKKRPDLKDLDSLQLELRKNLSGKKFLIVLDDVWNENYEHWDVVRRPFMAGAPGSKVLVTTRNEMVASIMKTSGAYHKNLQVLSNDACLSLLARHALGASNFDGHPILKGIGEEMVKKCKGLPLAAKALAGLLRGKVNYDEWEDMLRSKIWDIPEERGGIIPALKLSYHHLPSHLKRCFGYCAIFPEDYEFDKNELVRLWMAEGLIQQGTEEKQMWEKGLAYFDDLLSRSFFQKSNPNKTLFVMHDLINALAKSVAEEICFHFEDKLSASIEGIKKFRHLSFTCHQYEIFNRFEGFDAAKSLRTFIALPIDTSSWGAYCYMSKDVLRKLLAELRYLRVLCLSGYCFDMLPDSIGDLKHLRYLNLSYTTIEQLPESVGYLFNLQTFLLRGCNKLSKLPQCIENLINLLVLDLTDTDELVEMPLRIGKLKNLQVLSKFIVGKENQFGIKELKDLMHLKGKFCIMGLENVVDVRDARHANLIDKGGLDALDLQWSGCPEYRNEEDEMHVLEMLQPNKELKELSISFYGGERFPSWLGFPSITNVVQVNLHNCSRSMSLPALGRLPSLKKVFIQGMNRVKKVGREFYGDRLPSTKWFPSLEILWLWNMSEWECWSSPQEANVDLDDGFPSLRELMIQGCPKLIGNLPCCLSSLVKLTISRCPKLGGSHISLPSLCELNIEDCNKVLLENIVDLTSLTTLRIQGMRDLSCLPQEMLKSLDALQMLEVSNCTELTSLWQKGTVLKNIASLEHLEIMGCSKFVSLVVNEQGLPCSLEDMELMNCGNLKKLSLKSLKIESCPELLSFPEIGCLGRTTDCLLQDLEIEKCPSLTSFPRGILLTKLQRLKIRHCRDLQSLPEGIMQNDNSTNMSHLESLEIEDCPFLTCFPEGILPFSLKTLKISDCSRLEPLSERLLHNNASLENIDIWEYATLRYLPDCLHGFAHLTELTISDCLALISFPETGLPSTLRILKIYSCVNLKSLPERMQNLASLQYLTVSCCPCLVTFPSGGLPPQLLLLKVLDCINLKEPMSEWNLDSLTSLKELSIAGAPDIVSFPDENCLLPASLTSIFIARLNNLVSLSSGLQNLTSLEDLGVLDCPKLRHLPREGLPATLGRLYIRRCKHLIRKCLKKKGSYSSRIARIPCVEIAAD